MCKALLTFADDVDKVRGILKKLFVALKGNLSLTPTKTHFMTLENKMISHCEAVVLNTVARIGSSRLNFSFSQLYSAIVLV